MMDLLPEFKDVEELNELRAMLDMYDEQVAHREAEISEFDPEVESGIMKRCEAELNRLAHYRMELDPADATSNHKVWGQYLGIQGLRDRKEILQAELRDVIIRRSELVEQINELEAQLRNQPPGAQ